MMDKKEKRDIKVLDKLFRLLFRYLEDVYRKEEFEGHFIKCAIEDYDKIAERLQNQKIDFKTIYWCFDRILYSFHLSYDIRHLDKGYKPKTEEERVFINKITLKDKIGVLGRTLGTYLATVEYALASPVLEFSKQDDYHIGEILDLNKRIHNHLKNTGINTAQFKFIKRRLREIARNPNLQTKQQELILELAKSFGFHF